MPIWSQEQLFDIVLNNYKFIKSSKVTGKITPEEIELAIMQTERMEKWLDAPFRDKLDEELKRVYEEAK